MKRSWRVIAGLLNGCVTKTTNIRRINIVLAMPRDLAHKMRGCAQLKNASCCVADRNARSQRQDKIQLEKVAPMCLPRISFLRSQSAKTQSRQLNHSSQTDGAPHREQSN